MKYCPITYELIPDLASYSSKGLKLLSPKLQQLCPLDLNQKMLRTEAVARAGKMSIQGVQTKLSAQLKVKEGRFEIVSEHGHYILKPQSEFYPELPENEALSMSLAKRIGFEVPVHGLVYAQDNSLVYFVKRFDRAGHNQKLALEDFAQLSSQSRDTKYKSSMEKVAYIIEQFCSFPKIEKIKLAKLTLFNFLIGNEDMHLKNFSLITREKIITLSPVYDLLNTSIALSAAKEELALPIRGRKNNLSKTDLIDYFCGEILGVPKPVISKILEEFKQVLPSWKIVISHSFLSKEMQGLYLDLMEERAARLGL
jgi:serine/threonine-protein kinase HipA